MVALALILISTIDLFRHKIPHWALALLLIAIAIEDEISFHWVSALCILLISMALVLLADLGVGDLKLFLLLAATSIPIEELTHFLWVFSLASGLLLSLHILHTRSLKGYIPLAPAIAGAFLLI